jgi:hypothetical protein
MKQPLSWVVALGIAGLVSTGTVYGAEDTKDATPQQQRMADCNKTAADKGLKGDERKQFMSNCLSGKPDMKPAASTQQEKMKSCNAEAAKQSLKGDERKKFMSSCLSG